MSSVRIDHEGAVYSATDEHQHREIEARERTLRIKRIHDRITDPNVGAWGAAEEIEMLNRRIQELESK